MLLRATGLDDPVASSLVFRCWSEICQRYGSPAPCGEAEALPTGSFIPPDGTFLVGEVDGVAVACGGIRRCAEAPPGVGEIKRMYVEPAHRGRGLGRVLLAGLEAAADRLGYGTLWLETGTAQPEALRLYETSGWTPIPKYGEYKDEEDSRCYQKAQTGRGDPCLSEPVQRCSDNPTERRSACEQTTPRGTARHPAQG